MFAVLLYMGIFILNFKIVWGQFDPFVNVTNMDTNIDGSQAFVQGKTTERFVAKHDKTKITFLQNNLQADE
jgi:hypothetical protein